ncbi:tetratricopeptide repeat protein [Candidatus Uabimicrobium amorphum]|uniref:tetratricopeptide repeat protein n=1 Tax=Uabimicrobium amorphum TaxID=2596890 RepID=UPI0034A25390
MKYFFIFICTGIISLNAEAIIKRNKDSSYTIVAGEQNLWSLIDRMTKIEEREVSCEKWLQGTLEKIKPVVSLKRRSFDYALKCLLGCGDCYSLQEGNSIRILHLEDQNKYAIIQSYRSFLVEYSEYKSADKIYFDLGFLYMQEGDIREAQTEFYNLYRQYPKSYLLPNTLLLLAHCYILSEDTPLAIKALKRFFDLFPEHEHEDTASLMLAKCYRRQQKLVQAIKVYKYLLQKKSSNKAQLHLELGTIYLQQKEYQKALQSFDYIKKIAPAKSSIKAQAVYHKIVTFLQMGNDIDINSELVHFYQEYYTHPLSPKVRMLQLQFVKRKGNKDFTVFFLAKPLFTDPDPEVRSAAGMMAGTALMEIGLYERAASVMQKVLDSIEINNRCRMPLAQKLVDTYQQMKEWQKAKYVLKQIDHWNAQHSYLRLMECDFLAKNYKGCILTFDQYKDKISSHAVMSHALDFLGKSYLELGETDKAENAFSRIEVSSMIKKLEENE